MAQPHQQPDPADDHADEQPDGQPDHDERDGDHGGAAAEQDEHIRHHGQADERSHDQAHTGCTAHGADGQHGQIQHQQHGEHRHADDDRAERVQDCQKDVRLVFRLVVVVVFFVVFLAGLLVVVLWD